jgi:hypothetical protein
MLVERGIIGQNPPSVQDDRISKKCKKIELKCNTRLLITSATEVSSLLSKCVLTLSDYKVKWKSRDSAEEASSEKLQVREKLKG